MSRSKIILDLITDKIDVVQAMYILKMLLLENENIKIREWLDNEINGYKDESKVPDYRIVDCNVIGNIICYNMKYSNINIPIKKEYYDRLAKVKFAKGINEIIQLSIAEEKVENHSLIMPIQLNIINSIAEINGEIISASRSLTVYGITNIIKSIKSKLLDVYFELEKEYGNLDDYYIDFSDKKSEQKVNDKLVTIIYDNSSKVTIGDNNDIKNSNIGEENES